MQSPPAYRTVVLQVARESGGQFVYCLACLERVVGIFRRIFQLIFHNIWKKYLSTESVIGFVKEFPVLYDMS